MTDKHCKPSVTSGDDRVTAKDAVTECSEDFLQVGSLILSIGM